MKILVKKQKKKTLKKIYQRPERRLNRRSGLFRTIGKTERVRDVFVASRALLLSYVGDVAVTSWPSNMLRWGFCSCSLSVFITIKKEKREKLTVRARECVSGPIPRRGRVLPDCDVATRKKHNGARDAFLGPRLSSGVV
jgi:hypothetical protein